MAKEQWVSGYIKKWFDDKGYGFVSLTTGEDAFLHISSLPEDMQEVNILNMDVEVTVSETKKGFKVMNIRRHAK